MPEVLVFYHYLHPDDVVSAVQFTDLCVELARRGWRVKAMPSNRSWADDSLAFPPLENWRGVNIQRVWRPRFPQSRSYGRILNAIWMTLRWSLAALTEKPDFIIVGTDPILSVAVASVWRVLRPKTKIAHWCFDLYPEAAVADGIVSPGIAAIMRPVVAHAYRSCHLIADLGPCMAHLIAAYKTTARQITLTPWALAEPPAPLPVEQSERQALFGGATLALLYSGSFGRAHSSDLILRLARELEPYGARFVFSVRGNRVDALQQDAAKTSSVSFTPFASQDKLESRLSAPDIHIVSLREEWTGTVVPSKFFGALAAGRPVLFSGSRDSAIAHWIREHGVGWVLTEDTFEATAAELLEYSRETSRMAALFNHCHRVYQEHFSKCSVADKWDSSLRE